MFSVSMSQYQHGIKSAKAHQRLMHICVRSVLQLIDGMSWENNLDFQANMPINPLP